MKKPLRKRIPRNSDAPSNSGSGAPRRQEDDRAYTSNYGQERRPAPRKFYDKPGGDKRSFGPRPGEDRPFQKREGDKERFGPRPGGFNREGGENRHKSERREGAGGYNKNSSDTRKPFGGNAPGQEGAHRDGRKPFNRDAPHEGGYKGESRGERKPFGGSANDRKPYDRERSAGSGYNREGRDGDRKPFNRDAPREGGGGYKGNNPDGRKPYGSREDRDGDRKPFNRDAPREGGGYKGNNRDDRNSYGSRDGGDRKPYEGKKNFGDGGSDRPARPPFGSNNDRQERPAGGRPFGGGAPGSSRAGKRPPRAERAGNEGEERRPRREEDVRKEPRETYDRPVRRRDNQEAEDPQTAAESGAGMTLNKYLSRSGVCGRRQAGEIVKRGEVKVNGQAVTTPGYRVQETDIVVYEGKAIKPQSAKVYVLLNKPRGFITTTDDEEDRRTVMDLVQGAAPERLYPVGRLDRNTTGVLLLTNDGDLAQRLTHPKYESKKIYQVTLDREFEQEDFDKLQAGIPLEDGDAKPDALFYLENKTELGIEIHNGRNRIVRRMFEHLKYTVEKLDRMMFAGLTKKNVPRGKWRILSEKEIVLLKHFKS